MALTRRTARFGELASAIDAQLQQQGMEIDRGTVDNILRMRVDEVARQMGLTPRTALGYAPDNLPELIVAMIIEATRTPPAQPRRQQTARLRSVKQE